MSRDPSDSATILAGIPTPLLLDELDRRARAGQPPDVHFFGVWPGSSAGHYRRDRRGRMLPGSDSIPGRKNGLYPWDAWDPQSSRFPQPEGKFWHWYHRGIGLTVLTAWDRSADRRRGCCATFIVHGLVSPERAMTMAREQFASVFSRIETHLGRPAELAGPVDLATK